MSKSLVGYTFYLSALSSASCMMASVDLYSLVQRHLPVAQESSTGVWDQKRMVSIHWSTARNRSHQLNGCFFGISLRAPGHQDIRSTMAFRGRQLRAASVLLLLAMLAVPTCFTGVVPSRTRGTTAVRAEAAGAATGSTGSTSTALVKVTPENSIATAGVLGGVTGLLLGGFWIGAAGFVATSYLAKKEAAAGILDFEEAILLDPIDYTIS
eukprot:s557_g23.t1